MGYLEVQNACAFECVLSGAKRLYGSFVHSLPAAASWTSARSARMEKYIMSTREDANTELLRCGEAGTYTTSSHLLPWTLRLNGRPGRS
jgi:hypothetical protein